MRGDNGVAIDMDEVVDAVDEADVVVIGFACWAERLLFDLRVDELGTPPIIEVVAPVGGVHERTEWLNERRPGVPPAEQFLFFVWPHSIEYLSRSSLTERIERRVRAEQSIDVDAQLGQILNMLARRERRELAAAVAGSEGYETLWTAHTS